jgi:hypothetical protein
MISKAGQRIELKIILYLNRWARLLENTTLPLSYSSRQPTIEVQKVPLTLFSRMSRSFLNFAS